MDGEVTGSFVGPLLGFIDETCVSIPEKRETGTASFV